MPNREPERLSIATGRLDEQSLRDIVYVEGTYKRIDLKIPLRYLCVLQLKLN